MPLNSHVDGLTLINESGETLERRLDRVTRMLAAAIDHPAPAASTDVPRPHVSARIRPLTEEVERRMPVGEWDTGDALVARLLMDALTASLRSCRQVANDASARLDRVQGTVRRGERLREREAAKAR